MNDFLDEVRESLEDFERRARDNLDETGQRIFNETQETVPVETGALRTSGKLESTRLPNEHIVEFRWGGEEGTREAESVYWTLERPEGDSAWFDSLPLRDQEWMDALDDAWRDAT